MFLQGVQKANVSVNLAFSRIRRFVLLVLCEACMCEALCLVHLVAVWCVYTPGLLPGCLLIHLDMILA